MVFSAALHCPTFPVDAMRHAGLVSSVGVGGTEDTISDSAQIGQITLLGVFASSAGGALSERGGRATARPAAGRGE